MPERRLLEAWKQADADASSAERALKEAFTAYEEGRGPQPTIHQVIEARLQRDAAISSLSIYIQAASRKASDPAR